MLVPNVKFSFLLVGTFGLTAADTSLILSGNPFSGFLLDFGTYSNPLDLKLDYGTFSAPIDNNMSDFNIPEVAVD
jgi:hypothetical protein